jgi:hypothetical protein
MPGLKISKLFTFSRQSRSGEGTTVRGEIEQGGLGGAAFFKPRLLVMKAMT